MTIRASSRSNDDGREGDANGHYANWYPRLTLGTGNAPGAYAEYGELAGQMRFVERTSRKLARSTFYGMGRWQAGTEKHGAFLGRIVDIGAELFAMAAAVVDAQTAIREHPERAAETPGAGRGLLQPGPPAHGAAVPRAVDQRRQAQPRPRAARPQGAAHLAGGGHHGRIVRRRPRWSHRSSPTRGFRPPPRRRPPGPPLESDTHPRSWSAGE